MLRYDPEIRRALDAPVGRGPSDVPEVDVTDWRSSRAFFNRLIADGERRHPRPHGVTCERLSFVTSDGVRRELRWYRPDGVDGTDGGSAVLYLHGGGMYHGSLDLYDGIAARCAERAGVPVLSVDYRLAPEHPDPYPVRDCYEAMLWLAGHAEGLGVDPARIVVMGDSAGGGLAAGACLLSRDRGGPVPALQMLIYPMLDDRTATTPPPLAGLATWDHRHNTTAWAALLGDRAAGPDVSPYASPARAASLDGLPGAYLETGQLDLFCAETIDYARRLSAAGVQVELHVRPGLPHGFDFAAPGAVSTAVAVADRVRALGRV